MVKQLEKRIKDAFISYGFDENEVKDGCWLLERNNKPVAWIALHKFLERVADKAGITFDKPDVLNCEKEEVALYVSGCDKSGKCAWSIGEASLKNCKNDYRWAMAEKRAKDRVILKIVGVAGDMYSEEEADEFKDKRTPSEKAKETRENNFKSFEERFLKMYEWIKGNPKYSYAIDEQFRWVIDEAIKRNYDNPKTEEMLEIWEKLEKDEIDDSKFN